MTQLKPVPKSKKTKESLKRRTIAWRERLSSSWWAYAALLVALSLIVAFFLIPYPGSSLPHYRPGAIARSDIKATESLLIEDEESTEKKRKDAADAIPSVYDYDPALVSKISDKTPKGFQAMREFLASLNNQTEEDEKTGLDDILPQPMNEEARKTAVESARKQMGDILGIQIDDNTFQVLLAGKFSEDFETLILELLNSVMYRPIISNKDMLLAEGNKGINLRNIVSNFEILTRDFSNYLSLDQAQGEIRSRAMNFIGQYKYPSLLAATKLAQSMVQPNLTLNRSETQARKKAVYDEQKPVFYQIEKGEMIVREGGKITPKILDQLAMLRLKEQKRNDLMIGAGLAILVGLLFCICLQASGLRFEPSKGSFRKALFLSSALLLTFLLAIPSIFISQNVTASFTEIPVQSIFYSIPVPIGAMLVSVFVGMPTALLFSVVACFLVALVLKANMYYYIIFLLGSFVAARGVEGCRERACIIKTGLFVGLVNVVSVSAINMSLEKLLTTSALFDAVMATMGGILSGIIVTGLLPLAESTFGYTTNIRLLELANLDSPMLRDLMLRAPGTYYHSIVVGNLVEAAADAIGANSLLAKVSSYYHDVGKTKKPEYFIENQRGGANKHEKLAPSMSALILISHVKDGVERARKFRLGQDIIEIIRQHHGTNLISYFYDKAMEASSGREIREEDYRYPGPKPQTKEAGLVLLADAVEAASRTLQEPNPSRIQGMVQKIINKLFSDGQLDECELTLKDLHQIAKSFNQILIGIFHHRIEYPEPAEKGAPARKAKNGSTHRKSATPGKDQPRENQEGDQENLKRLGL